MKLLIVLATVALGAHCKNLQARVVNGEDARINDYPYVVSVKACTANRQCNYCAGTIIARGLVVTAAHCVLDSTRRRLPTISVRAGSVSNIRAPAAAGDINVASVNFPPTYSTVRTPNINRPGLSVMVPNQLDLAVLKLATCLTFTNNIKAINLVPSTFATVYDSIVTVVGWGATDVFNSQIPTTLKFNQVRVISDGECARFSHSGVNSSQICTFERAVGLCTADAGSPLIADVNGVKTAIGIYSHTSQWNSYDGIEHEMCGLNPDIYTSIASLRNFIDSSFNYRGNSNVC